jgi:hypothetical protein
MLRNNGRHNFRSPFGIQPSLVLDFAGTGTLDPRVTFTRSTTATYTNNSGVLVSSAINAARFDYNPTTLICNGLFNEEARTNILLNSLLNGTNLSTQSVTTTAVPYTLSFYGTGTIALSGTNISTQIGSGLYPSRKTFTFTPTAGTLTLTVTGTVQYAQLEVGSFASSFIPTAGSQVTRAADLPSITGTNLSSWYNQSEGSFIINVIPEGFNASADNQIFSNGACNLPALTFYGNTYNPGTACLFSVANGSGTIGQVQNCGYAYKAGGSYSSRNGSATVSNSNAGALDLPTAFAIGRRYTANDRFLNGWVQKISYYPQRITTDQLITLTT